MGVFYARSGDGGASWSAPAYIHEPGPRPGQLSSFGFPVISRSGRIYCFYNWSSGVGEGLLNAVLRCRYSDDDGHSWIEGGVEIPYRRTRFDHPDPSVQPIGIVWQKPVRDALDRPVAGLTRTTAAYVRPATDASHMGGLPNRPGGRPWHRWMGECRCEFVRFDNIDEGPDPRDVRVTWLPDDEELIWVPVTFEPQASEGLTFCQEPGLVLLPDDRLFTAMRTSNGDIWYTVSDDHGHSWRPSEVLRYRDGGERMLNPIAPTPMFRLEDGRYLLFLQNHDGWGYGGHGPRDLSSRRPQFLSVGEFRPGAHQPVWVQRTSVPIRRRGGAVSQLHDLAVDVREHDRAGWPAHPLVHGPQAVRAGPVHHRRDAGAADRAGLRNAIDNRARRILGAGSVRT